MIQQESQCAMRVTDKIAIVKAKGRLKTLIEKTDAGVRCSRNMRYRAYHAGRLMGNHLKQMPILIVQMINL